jgi:hypothetical protein
MVHDEKIGINGINGIKYQGGNGELDSGIQSGSLQLQLTIRSSTLIGLPPLTAFMRHFSVT